MAFRWSPLENSPEVLTKYIHELGVEDNFSLVDVFSLDDDMLAMVPQPVGALLLVCPVKDGNVSGDGDSNPSVFFMKQTIENAGGTVGLLNALGNSKARYKADSALDKFMKSAKGNSPVEIARLLETNDSIREIHTSVAKEGPTSTSGSEENVDLHFVALALVDGHIHELDGRNDKPTKLDASDESSFLKNAAAVCKAYMERNPGHFSLTALIRTHHANLHLLCRRIYNSGFQAKSQQCPKERCKDFEVENVLAAIRTKQNWDKKLLALSLRPTEISRFQSFSVSFQMPGFHTMCENISFTSTGTRCSRIPQVGTYYDLRLSWYDKVGYKGLIEIFTTGSFSGLDEQTSMWEVQSDIESFLALFLCEVSRNPVAIAALPMCLEITEALKSESIREDVMTVVGKSVSRTKNRKRPELLPVGALRGLREPSEILRWILIHVYPPSMRNAVSGARALSAFYDRSFTKDELHEEGLWHLFDKIIPKPEFVEELLDREKNLLEIFSLLQTGGAPIVFEDVLSPWYGFIEKEKIIERHSSKSSRSNQQCLSI